jgi:hypothetical protein
MADAPQACYRNSVVFLLQATAAAYAAQTGLASPRNAFAAGAEKARSSVAGGGAAEASPEREPFDDQVPLGAGASEAQ